MRRPLFDTFLENLRIFEETEERENSRLRREFSYGRCIRLEWATTRIFDLHMRNFMVG